MDKGHSEALRVAARELVRAKGLSRTTARDLVSASGTNLRSIGYHFGSKDALMAEVLAHISAEWSAGPIAASRADEGAPPGDRMANAVRVMLSDLDAKLDDLFVFIEGVTEARHSPELGARMAATQEECLTAIGDSIGEGAPGLDPAVQRLLARLLVAVHDGLALQLAVAPGPDVADPEVVIQALAGLGISLAAGLGIPGAADVLDHMIHLGAGD